MNKVLDCLTSQLMKMRKSYEHNRKGLILLCDLAENTGQKNNYINSYKLYNESIDDKLVNEHHQLKENLRLVTEQEELK